MPDYGAFRFTRVGGPTPDAPDVYSLAKNGRVSPGRFENSGRPIWSTPTGQAYAEAATYRERIRADLAADNPALLVLDREFETQSVDPMALEPESGLAWYDARRKNLELVISVQSPYEAAGAIAYLLGNAQAAFKPARINTNFASCGGGFGGRDSTPFPLYVALAAMFFPNRPVRLANNRFEQFQSGIKRHAFKIRTRLGVDRATGKRGRTLAGNTCSVSMRTPEVLDKLEKHPIWRERADEKARGQQAGILVGTGVAVCDLRGEQTGVDGGHRCAGRASWRRQICSHRSFQREVSADRSQPQRTHLYGVVRHGYPHRDRSRNRRVADPKAYNVLECGQALVPEVVLGQVQGGFAMGVGYALLEKLPLYEDGPGNGTWNLGQYVITRGSDLPLDGLEVEVLPPVVADERPKGIAEAGIIPVVPALLNAICDATGHRFRSLPVTRAMIKGVLK
jgi:CO/xanthine dehydrogenase Mo-binding subunit